jgi:hypothetical protein
LTKRETALKLLIEEHDELGRAIAALQLVVSGERRRGRPPGVKAKPAPPADTDPTIHAIAKPAKRKKFSAATRRRMAEAQRARYAAARVANEAAPAKRKKQKAMSA